MEQAVTTYLALARKKLAGLEQDSERHEQAARLMAEAALAGQSLFVFGASHAGILAEELSYRAGGLAIFNPLFSPTLMLNVRPLTLTSDMENVAGLGAALLAASPLRAGDVVLVNSVSGRNAAPLDVALEAKRRGASVVAVTSLATAARVTPRHASGKLLAQVADIVLDNHCDYGDAAIALPGLAQRVAPLSTLMAAAIGNCLVLRICAIMQASGRQPPVLASANIDGNREINQDIFYTYRDQIHYL
ncbi:SIS domain-containing protein [Affinibrenneria salicis]|uniref:SIS domain-containing protein n=1 Tax=Affinibrenneria salicis TaxID=2590031 RepID=A0A5J5FXV7_9GAMM|nr:SIS domain-containing protein [Affinibrenneria salicis]KAA8998436.1 SIS domain-containing protein [Affinibrenneria salicis]